MKRLYTWFLENIRAYSLIIPHDTVILGFSGGKDSVTLFLLLKELKKDIPFDLMAAYFNHGLRKDADAEEKWVRAFCENQGVELVVGAKNVGQFKKETGLNLEHAASLSRYQFFQEISSRYTNAKVATAHTRSDLTETFFIKLFRGSGLQGLSAIASKKGNNIIRPLLLFSQGAILSFIQRNSIEFYQDPTNREDLFLRNRIRHHLVPEIEKIEPDIDNHIFQTVSIIQEEYDYFSETAGAILDQHLILGEILPLHILEEYHLAMQRHVIREYIRLLKGNLLNIGFAHIEAVRTRAQSMRGLAIPGLELKFHKGYIFPAGLTVPGYCYRVDGPGALEIKETRQKLHVREIHSFQKPWNNHEIIIPTDLAVFPLTVRNPQREDKYVKINSTVKQKVFEMIRASGIPAEMRNLRPVVLNGDGRIIWAAGSPASEPFKVENKNDKNLLKIALLPLSSPLPGAKLLKKFDQNFCLVGTVLPQS
ncbi:MAG: tRNA lysidine(34) synthetase TilS [Candidatus Aminicenantes bacterium]|nr:tRNA lysidine(34) synthetase TilS [Candidatus Aminicenantes bacterium]